jgi:hypothetical protein
VLRPPLTILAALVSLTLIGCGSTADHRLVVVERESREPVRGAYVRAIAMDAGLAQLPLTPAVLAEVAAIEAPSAGFTDARGRVTVAAVEDRPVLIEVEPPPTAGAPNAAAWPRMRWLVADDPFTPPEPAPVQAGDASDRDPAAWPYALERQRAAR